MSLSEYKTNSITVIMLFKFMHNCLQANVFQAIFFTLSSDEMRKRKCWYFMGVIRCQKYIFLCVYCFAHVFVRNVFVSLISYKSYILCILLYCISYLIICYCPHFIYIDIFWAWKGYSCDYLIYILSFIVLIYHEVNFFFPQTLPTTYTVSIDLEASLTFWLKHCSLREMRTIKEDLYDWVQTFLEPTNFLTLLLCCYNILCCLLPRIVLSVRCLIVIQYVYQH